MEKQRKLKSMLVLTLLFFFVELICGYASGSLALISDSFHMLSDVASFVIALYASKMAKSKNHSKALSYGLKRAEVLGALINGVSLLALCFTLVISAIQRFVTPEEIENPKIVLVVAIVGLGVNIIGMFMFHDHSHHGSHSHHHHEHDHADHSHDHDCSNHDHIRVDVNPEEGNFSDPEDPNDPPEIEKNPDIRAEVIRVAHLMQSSENLLQNRQFDRSNPGSQVNLLPESENLVVNSEKPKRDMNMHGVFLHILGDFLGSVGVVFSTLCVLLIKQPWTVYVDPFMSLFITCIIVTSSIPLVRSASFILLQGAPESLSVEALKQDILQIAGVLDVHELHVWQLSDTQTIASVHVLLPNRQKHNDDDYMDLAVQIKRKLHAYGIHSTTVQPEFLKDISDDKNVITD